MTFVTPSGKIEHWGHSSRTDIDSGRALCKEAKSSRTDLDFSISEPGRFQTRGKPRRIDKHHGVANVEDLHQQGPQAIGSRENTARFEDSVHFGK